MNCIFAGSITNAAPAVPGGVRTVAPRSGRARVVPLLAASLLAIGTGAARAQPDVPLALPGPAPSLLAASGPPADPLEAPSAPGAALAAPDRDAQQEARRGYWRSLSPAQREAIRRLSQEQRQALANRPGPRQGGVVPPGGRLTPEERRQLRAQIREDHERHGGRASAGHRP
jgi:hypothetical protein